MTDDVTVTLSRSDITYILRALLQADEILQEHDAAIYDALGLEKPMTTFEREDLAEDDRLEVERSGQALLDVGFSMTLIEHALMTAAAEEDRRDRDRAHNAEIERGKAFIDEIWEHLGVGRDQMAREAVEGGH